MTKLLLILTSYLGIVINEKYYNKTIGEIKKLCGMGIADILMGIKYLEVTNAKEIL